MRADPSKMTPAERAEFRDVCVAQALDPRRPLPARLWAARMAGRMAVELADAPGARDRPRQAPRVPPRVPARRDFRPVDDRASDARAFLYGQQDTATAERAESARRFLHPETDPALAARAAHARASLGIGGPSRAQQEERWQRAVWLHGSPTAARQHGYRPPQDDS